jgi:large subunit ribosomal protein L21
MRSGRMYAIVDFLGVQVRVAENETVRVPLVDRSVGETFTLDRVLFVGGSSPKVGTPTVKGVKVEAEVVAHGRGKKVIVGKFMRRKDYHRKNGHRQSYTDLRIVKIA